MMKYEITREQILELEKRLRGDDCGRLKQWFPDAFKPVFEAGKWYIVKSGITKRALCCITDFEKGTAYGFSASEKWLKDGDHSWSFKYEPQNWAPATEREITNALDKESKNRGFTDGVYFKDLVTCKLCRIKGNFRYMNNELSQLKHLSQTLFKDGVWAEIIPTMTKSEAEAKLNCKIV